MYFGEREPQWLIYGIFFRDYTLSVHVWPDNCDKSHQPYNYQINNKIELRILEAMNSCFGLVRPRQHGIANT